MKIEYYVLPCDNKECGESWFTAHKKQVIVTLELRTNKYIFVADCPRCGHYTETKRDAFVKEWRQGEISK